MNLLFPRPNYVLSILAQGERRKKLSMRRINHHIFIYFCAVSPSKKKEK